MILFPNEKIILESDNKDVVLTSHRIYQKSGGFGVQQTTSIMLEHVSSCQTYVKYHWIIIGIMAFIGGALFLHHDNGFALIVCGTLAAMFYFSKKSMIIIKSPTATININTGNLSDEAISRFVDKVEQTKHERVQKINKGYSNE